MKDPIMMKNCKHSFCSKQKAESIIVYVKRRHSNGHPCSRERSNGGRKGGTINDNNNDRASAREGTPSSLSSSLACSVCQEEIEDLEESFLKRAIHLSTEANVRNIVEADCMALRREALVCVDKVMDIPNCNIQAYFLKANTLLSMGNAQKALETVDELLVENRQRDNHPVLLLIKDKEGMVGRGGAGEIGRLQEQVLAAVQQHGMPATRIGSDQLFAVFVLQSEAYQGLERWKEAMDSYKSAMISLDSPDAASAVNQRNLFMSLAECAYKVQEYDKAIESANAAIETNRHFPGIHRINASAQEKLGRLDEAIVTMNRAVLYETPWDKANQREVLNLYNELLSKKKSLQAAAII